MHGNVWEWVWDWDNEYTSEALVDPRGPDHSLEAGVDEEGAPQPGIRLDRGGAFHTTASETRSAMRGGLWPGGVDGDMGFRVARDAPKALPVGPN